MKSLKFIALLLGVLFVFLDPADASKFKLKNMPEKYALFEGAIVEEDEQSITIITKDAIHIRTKDSIEILERTPAEDKKFIETYGPENKRYQVFLGNEEKKETPSISSELSGEKFLLCNQFEKGESAYMITSGNIETQTNMGAMKVPVKMDMQMLSTVKVLDVNESNVATYELKIDEAQTEMDMAGRKRTMDMKKMMGDQLKPMVMKVNAKGELVDEESSETSFLPNQAMQGLHMGNLQQNVMRSFPEKEVQIGDSWSDDKAIELPGMSKSLNMSSTRTLESVKVVNGEKIATISNEYDMSGDNLQIDPKSLGSMGGGAATQNIDVKSYQVKGKETYQFNIDQGRTISLNVFQTDTIKMEANDQMISAKSERNLSTKVVYSISEMQRLWKEIK